MNLKFIILVIAFATLSENGTAEEDNTETDQKEIKEDSNGSCDNEKMRYIMIGDCCKQLMETKNNSNDSFTFEFKMGICISEKAHQITKGLVTTVKPSKYEDQSTRKILSGPIFDRQGFPPIKPFRMPPMDPLAMFNDKNFPFNGFPPIKPFRMPPMDPFSTPPVYSSFQQWSPFQQWIQPQGIPPPRQSPSQQRTGRSRRSPSNTGSYQVFTSPGTSMNTYGVGSSIMQVNGVSTISTGDVKLSLNAGKVTACNRIKKVCLEVDLRENSILSQCKEPESVADCPALVEEIREKMQAEPKKV